MLIPGHLVGSKLETAFIGFVCFFAYTNTKVDSAVFFLFVSVLSVLNLEVKTDTLTEGAREGSHSGDQLPPVLRKSRRRSW